MSRVGSVVALIAVGAAAWVADTCAGNNAGATARLSWSQASAQADLPSMTGRVPLYLKLENAWDVQQLAVDVQWSPYDLMGPCFYLRPDSAYMGYCGVSVNTPPDGPFEGDSTYNWTIRFSGSEPSDCVTYWVDGDNCSARSARFCLISVYAKDSEGNVDEIVVLESATIGGGGDIECPGSITAFAPEILPMGATTTLHMFGDGLGAGTWAELRNEDTTYVGQEFGTDSENQVHATFEIPSEGAGEFELVVGNDGGFVALADSTVTVTDTYVTMELQAVSGVPNCDVVTLFWPSEPSSYCQRMLTSTAICPSTLFPSQACGEGIEPHEYLCKFTFTKNGQRAKNLPVVVHIESRPFTGSHCHNTGPPKPAAYIAAGGGYVPITEKSGTTNNNGDFNFTFITPEVTGEIRLYPTTDDEEVTFSPAEFRIAIRVPDLAWSRGLPTPGPTAFENVQPGGTNHHQNFQHIRREAWDQVFHILDRADVGPLDLANFKLRPTDLLVKYAVQRYMVIGDISLPYGGVLDEFSGSGGDWGEPMCLHRWGMSVDFTRPPIGYDRLVMHWMRHNEHLGSINPPPDMLQDRFKLQFHRSSKDTRNRFHLEFRRQL